MIHQLQMILAELQKAQASVDMLAERVRELEAKLGYVRQFPIPRPPKTDDNETR